MAFKCVDCKRFMGCTKNSEAWEKAKKLYPVSIIEDGTDFDVNEKPRLQYIDTVAARCQERIN